MAKLPRKLTFFLTEEKDMQHIRQTLFKCEQEIKEKAESELIEKGFAFWLAHTLGELREMLEEEE